MAETPTHLAKNHIFTEYQNYSANLFGRNSAEIRFGRSLLRTVMMLQKAITFPRATHRRLGMAGEEEGETGERGFMRCFHLLNICGSLNAAAASSFISELSGFGNIGIGREATLMRFLWKGNPKYRYAGKYVG